jgi:hypothetical protein
VAWEARTGPRQTQTCSDTPATARLRRGRPLTTLAGRQQTAPPQQHRIKDVTVSCCFPQLLLRAKLITLFLIPECAQPAFRLNREESHVSIRVPERIDFL